MTREREYLRDSAMEPMQPAESITKRSSTRMPATACNTSSAMVVTSVNFKTFDMADKGEA